MEQGETLGAGEREMITCQENTGQYQQCRESAQHGLCCVGSVQNIEPYYYLHSASNSHRQNSRDVDQGETCCSGLKYGKNIELSRCPNPLPNHASIVQG